MLSLKRHLTVRSYWVYSLTDFFLNLLRTVAVRYSHMSGHLSCHAHLRGSSFSYTIFIYILTIIIECNIVGEDPHVESSGDITFGGFVS